VSSADGDTGIGGCFRRNENNRGKINEHIKKERNSLKFQYRIGQSNVK